MVAFAARNLVNSHVAICFSQGLPNKIGVVLATTHSETRLRWRQRQNLGVLRWLCFLLENDRPLLIWPIKNFAKAMSTGHALRSSALCGLRSWAILGVTAIIVFLTLGIWRLFPVYPDEIFYRALVSHAFFGRCHLDVTPE